MSKSGTIVVTPSGNRGVLKSGNTAVFNEKENCPGCCGECYFFTVNAPSDAIDADGGLVTKPHAAVMELLRQNGRKYGRIKPGKYAIIYQGGYVSHGCSRYNCSHYINYYVTTLGVLPGLIGPWDGAPGPPQYHGNVNNAKVLQDLEELKKREFVYTQDEEDDFKVGFWPWYYASYSRGSMTFCLRPIMGRVTEWTGTRGKLGKEPTSQEPPPGPVVFSMRTQTTCTTTGNAEYDEYGNIVTVEPSILDREANRCRWMIDTGINAGGGCRCNWVECDFPESPLYRGLNPDKPFRWKSRQCNPNNCRFFEKNNGKE